MKDLIDFKNAQIEALQSENCYLRKKVEELSSYIFELCLDDCPEEYKNIVKREII